VEVMSPPVVQTGWISPDSVSRTLDAGAVGPMPLNRETNPDDIACPALIDTDR